MAINLTIKKVFYICCLSIFLQNVCGNDPSSAQLDSDHATNLDKLFRDGFDTTNVEGDVIVLLGSTGGGKSTLSKFIRKDGTLKVSQVGKRRFIFEDSESTIGSKNSLQSKTLFPNIDVDPDTGIIIADCGGFEDTRSQKHDLIVGFLNKLMLESAKRIKVVIVENFSNVKANENRNAFAKTLEHIGNLVGSNINSLVNSFGLIATKVDSADSDEDVIDEILDFLNESLQFSLDIRKDNKSRANFPHEAIDSIDRKVLILNSLLHRNAVAIFRKPHKLGSPWENSQLRDNFLKIRHVIFDLAQFSTPFEAKFHITVDPKTVVYIKDVIMKQASNTEREMFSMLYKALQQKFIEFIETMVRPWSAYIERNIAFCQNYLATLDTVETLSELESFMQRRGLYDNKHQVDLRFIILKRSFLLDAVDTIQGEAKQLKDFNEHKIELQTYVSNVLKFYQVFKEIHKGSSSYQFQKNIFTTKPSLLYFFRNIEQYGLTNADIVKIALEIDLNSKFVTEFGNAAFNNKQQWKIEDSVLVVYGQYIILSEVIPLISSQLDEVVLVASRKIFIDCDLEMKHTHLHIAAPVVEVIGAMKTIDLRGENGVDGGEKLMKAETNTKRGESGKAGSDASSSGSLKMQTLLILNSQFLQLTTKGGKGGNGQDGGDGADAKPKPQNSVLGYYPTYEKFVKLRDSLKAQGYYFNTIPLPYTSDEGHARFGHNAQGKVYYQYTITGGSDLFAPPTKGGDGGKAGAGATYGDQILLVRDKHRVNLNKVLTQHGLYGKGGIAGYTSARCYVMKNDCYSYSIMPSRLSIACYKLSSVLCDPYENAAHGKNGESVFQPLSKNYKKNKHWTGSGILAQSMKLIFEQSTESEFDLISKEFLAYLLETDSGIDLKYFLKFLKASNKLIFQINRTMSKQYFKHLKEVYLMVWNNFREKLNVCQHCDSAMVSLIEILFVDQLSTIETFFDGKQITKLSARVSKYSTDISISQEYLKNYGKFQLVKRVEQTILSDIKDAEVIINKLFTREMADVEKGIDENLNEILQKTVQKREAHKQNIEKLQSMRNEVNKAMKAKVALGVLNSISLVSSAIYPPAAILTQTVTGLVSSTTTASDTNYAKYQALIAKGTQNAGKAIVRFANKTMIGQSILRSALQNVINSENENDKIISEKNRKDVVDLVSGQKNKLSFNTTLLLTSLIDDFQARIDSLEKSNVKEIINLERLKTGLTVAVNMAGAAVEVVNTVKSYSHDQSLLTEIHATIQANQVALSDLAEYEKILQTTFVPTLQEMVTTFDRFKSNSSSANDFEREFQRFDLKKYARECISLINKVTEGFDDDGSFAGIFSTLQDFITTIIDVYEKISDYKYRANLTHFLGQMNSGQCSESLTSDPETCSLYQSAFSEIEGTKLSKNFVHIFKAYQQVMFPYGGEQMQLLSSTMSNLFNDSSMTVPNRLKLLQGALKIIKDRLDEDDQTIVNDKDKFISFAQFNSHYKSQRPFFVWSASKFGPQIKKLLNGEQVSFVASVLQPGTENAVKFKTIMLNMTSGNPTSGATVRDLLGNFEVEMTHGGESYYRCGTRFYSIPGERQTFKLSFERDERGELVSVNRVWEKFKYGDVPLSPYASWRFQLKCKSKKSDCPSIFEKLALLAHKVDLELIGSGYYLEEGAPICNSDLSHIYTSFAMSIL